MRDWIHAESVFLYNAVGRVCIKSPRYITPKKSRIKKPDLLNKGEMI